MDEDNINKGNDKPLGKTGITELIELMQSNNKSTGEIEKDGRNTRRHLLEMKNMQKVMNDFQARSVYGFENFQDIIDSQKLQDVEDTRENKTIFEEIRDELRSLPKETAQATASESKGDGITSKLGGILKGAGFAAAGVGVGIAAIFSQAPKLVETFENMDVKKISNQVSGLIGINKRVEEEGGNLLVDGGSFLIGMGFIGAGLALFAAGGTFAGASDYFLKDNWVETIQQNVSGLLAIGANVSGSTAKSLGESGAFFLSMAGLGAGLAIFAIGKTASGVAEAITMFTSGDNFAEDIKQEVGTLLTIPDLPGAKLGKGGLATFIATMGGLMVGLLAFSIGKGVAGVADVATATSMFQNSNFGADIRDEVKALLEIPSLPGVGGDTAKFYTVMAGLSAGLATFAIGKGGVGVADFLSLSGGQNFAEDIKSEVETLLSIGEGADAKRTLAATGALTSLGIGLAAFASGKGLGALANLASSAVSFFTGKKDPITQAITLGDNADKVQKGADAFDDFAEALGKFSNINFKFDSEKFIEEASNSAKAIEAIMKGGDIEIPGLFNDVDINPGLSQLVPQMDKFSSSMIRMQSSMSSGDTSGMERLQKLEGMMINNMSVENALLKIPQQQAPASISTVGQNNVNTTNNSVIVTSGSDALKNTQNHLRTDG